jgi:hypothetical protein
MCLFTSLHFNHKRNLQLFFFEFEYLKKGEKLGNQIGLIRELWVEMENEIIYNEDYFWEITTLDMKVWLKLKELHFRVENKHFDCIWAYLMFISNAQWK